MQRQMFVLSGPIMGSDYRITVVTDLSLDKEIVHQQVFAVMEAVNQSMSTYIDTSEISLINRAKAGEEITISDPFVQVLKQAQTVSELSNGAFDITVGPIVNLWGFGSNGAITKQPNADEIRTVSQSVGYQTLSLQGNQLVKNYDETQLDLSAIAKGYAVDMVAQSLEKQGVNDYLINIGGELRAAGENIDQQVWRIGIEKPEMLGGIQEIIKLDNMAVATSGDYLNFLLIDEEYYSHTIDPKTLSPVLHKLALVSVIHQEAALADALATAMMVMGEKKAWAFAEERKIAAYFAIRDESGAGINNQYTSGFAEFIDQND